MVWRRLKPRPHNPVHDLMSMPRLYKCTREIAIFPKAFLGIPAQQGDCSHYPNDSRRFRKARIFTTQKTLRENTCWGLLGSCLAAED
jgi:hypothetical protein